MTTDTFTNAVGLKAQIDAAQQKVDSIDDTMPMFRAATSLSNITLTGEEKTTVNGYLTSAATYLKNKWIAEVAALQTTFDAL